jgi:hypothetical protein
MAYKSKKTCTYPDCGRPHNSKGYCPGHRKMQLEGRELKSITTRGEYTKSLTRNCCIDGCERKVKSRGYCGSHYNRIIWRKKDSEILRPINRKEKINCSYENCDTTAIAKGMCSIHYQKMMRASKPPKTTQPKKTRVYPIRLCSIEGCGRKHEARGYCKSHYTRVIVCGLSDALLEPRSPIRKGCLIEGCHDKHKSKGYCAKHYYNLWLESKDNIKNKKIPCEIDNCEGFQVNSRGWCGKHYERWRVHGDVNVNYHRKNKRTSYSINKTPITFTHSHEEVMIMNEFFEEMTGVENYLERFE